MAEYVTQNDLETFGPDLLNVTKRVTNTVVEPRLQNLERQLAAERRRRLDDQVARAVPDFQEIDRRPDWHRWLLGIDELSGRVRQLLLNEAISSGSAARVKNFFDQFKREAGGAQAQSSTSTRSSRTTRSAPGGKPVYTREDIGRLYEAHRKGAYANREAEWARIEADFFAAQREGRVVGPDYITK